MSTNVQSTVEPPRAMELLTLVARFLDEEISPAVSDEKLRFRVRVASNLLQIARRECEDTGNLTEDRDGHLVTDEMIASAGTLQALRDAFLDDERDVMEPATFRMLRDYVDAKLRIAVPALLRDR